jgi:hypothetical protein
VHTVYDRAPEVTTESEGGKRVCVREMERERERDGERERERWREREREREESGER